MKKIVAVIAFIGLSQALLAQKVYVQGGLNLANITTNNNGDTEDNAVLPTFNVGFMSQFGISKAFDLETGLLLQGRGSKAETTFNNGDFVKSRFNPLYVELPLNAIVKIPTGGSTGLFVNAGPYVAMGVGGKSKFDSQILGITSSGEEDIQFNNDDPTTSGQEGAAYNKLKRFDYGVNLGAGFDLKSVIIKANYGLGFAKINSTETNNSANDKNKYRTLSLSVGIPLGN